MAKALLVSADMKYDVESLNIRSMSDNSVVSSVHGNGTYTYHLTYISYEPLNMSDFPAEINTDKNTSNVTIKKVKDITKEEKARIKVINSISQLDLSEAGS